MSSPFSAILFPDSSSARSAKLRALFGQPPDGVVESRHAVLWHTWCSTAKNPRHMLAKDRVILAYLLLS
jgi:hypothetical protein